MAAVAAAVSGCPAVAGLHAGPLGTYRPGGRVSGIRLDGGDAHVVVDLAYPATVTDLAAQVRDALRSLIPGKLSIEVADVILPGEQPAGDAGPAPAPPATSATTPGGPG